MSTLMTRVNGVAVVITRVENGNYLAEPGECYYGASSFEAPQMFVAANLAMIEAAFHGHEYSAYKFTEEFGFMTATVAQLGRESWEFAPIFLTDED